MALFDSMEYGPKTAAILFGEGCWARLAHMGTMETDRYGARVVPLIIIPGDDLKKNYGLKDREELNILTPGGNWACEMRYPEELIVPLSPYSALEPTILIKCTFRGEPTKLMDETRTLTEYLKVMQAKEQNYIAIILSLVQDMEGLEVTMRERVRQRGLSVAMIGQEPYEKDEDEAEEQNYQGSRK